MTTPKKRFSATREARWRAAGLITTALEGGWDLTADYYNYTDKQSIKVELELLKLSKRLERGYKL